MGKRKRPGDPNKEVALRQLAVHVAAILPANIEDSRTVLKHVAFIVERFIVVDELAIPRSAMDDGEGQQ